MLDEPCSFFTEMILYLGIHTEMDFVYNNRTPPHLIVDPIIVASDFPIPIVLPELRKR
jgi:hypothetical protein